MRAEKIIKTLLKVVTAGSALALVVYVALEREQAPTVIVPDTPTAAQLKSKSADPLEKYYCLAPELKDLAADPYVKPLEIKADPEGAAKDGAKFLWYIHGNYFKHEYCYGFGATLPIAVEDAKQHCTPEYEAARKAQYAPEPEDEKWKNKIPKYQAELAKQMEMCLPDKSKGQ